MTSITRMVAAVALAAPLIVAAQTTPATPATTPSTGTPGDAMAAPKGKTTKGSNNNQSADPAGAKSSKGADSSASPNTTPTDVPSKGGNRQPGDVTTYPAPAKDGTPTK